MPEPYCDHCDLPLAQCEHGRPSPPPEKFPWDCVEGEPTGASIDATMTGRCVVCDRKIEVGGRIAYLPSHKGWAHAGVTDDLGFDTI